MIKSAAFGKARSLAIVPRHVAFLGLFLALFASACSSPIIEGDLLSLEPARPPKTAATIQELLPWTRPGHAAPVSFEIESPPGEFVTAYEVIEGEHSGGILLEARREGPDPGTWIITRRIEGQEKPLEERHQALDAADGSLVLPYSLNFERGVRVEMDPPPFTVPARLEPGETLSREMRIRLPLIENPRRLREKGTALSEFTYVDDQRVRTDVGTFDARHLREVFTSRFAAANAVRTIDRWYSPGRGLVAERWHEEVTVLGVVIERTNFAMRVIAPATRDNRRQSSEIEPDTSENRAP